MADSLNLDEILAFAISIAREMIRDGQAKRFDTGAGEDEKANSVDVDKAVEDFLVAKIAEKYPEHKFIGEETYEGQEITDAPTWIVDPIDGTTNFIHGFPMVATSIGLAVGGEPVVGVVYNPFLDQLYSAAKGKGAFLNEKTRLPLMGKVKPLYSLDQALIAVEYGSSRKAPALPAKLNTFKNLTADKSDGGQMVHSLRSLGSAALNLCQVATGGVDLYWEIGCWPWDVCAGMSILAEAGGASYGGKADDTAFNGQPTAKIMAGRKYLFVRNIAAPVGQTTRDAQAHIAREFYQNATEWTP
ncbi:uncharacterized protein EHS24_008562 [Apiotrichum porosum]|uniref:Inositol-1-monophosphatase n=1 Tax=Apiotrichum porosum TaxID=105984 RepID=A0A427XQQ7_9TREE|nr:uncharacterized protein EHS24_008562 [Apiotrichum porosum]RSH81128.1 hypothetical protein EHS24_008562 [Apiotrichum porosum]